MYRLVIFDLDGTVIDSLLDIHYSLNETLLHFNLPVIEVKKTKSLIGDGVHMLLKKAFGEDEFKKKEAEIVEHFKNVYRKNLTNKTKTIDGFDKVLKYLENTNIIKIILSNKLYEFTDMIMKNLNLNRYIDDYFGGDSFVHKKPSPYPILEIQKRFAINKNDTLVIGDNYTDIEAGLKSESKTCFCEYGYGKLNNYKPHYRVKKPIQILDILENG
ncbi:MAG: HAD family hydrolase [Deferribacterota bacterium]|nr:HAD family hydrolase [Deferribacterota bacterium]